MPNLYKTSILDVQKKLYANMIKDDTLFKFQGGTLPDHVFDHILNSKGATAFEPLIGIMQGKTLLTSEALV